MKIQTLAQEPAVAVGLIQQAPGLEFILAGDFLADDGERLAAGTYRVALTDGQFVIRNQANDVCLTARQVTLQPVSADASFTIKNVTIGINFHWERQEDQRFQGALRLQMNGETGFDVINQISVEGYLTSVISSEMSAAAHPDLLKAHAIISRSWLLAQMHPWKTARRKCEPKLELRDGEPHWIRWYDQESHSGFDVCADDHCQRYQGITKATSPEVFATIRETRGQVLAYDGELCDARFSKSCGGMTESFAAAWDEVALPYLAVSYDGEDFPAEYSLPLSEEENAAAWIRQSPSAFCNTNDQKILAKILPDFDQETSDFYRWRATLTQAEIQALLPKKLGRDFGAILRLEPVERGASGRLVKLRIVGEKQTLVIGKELEIRRALSPSHLYSSAFVIEADSGENGVPAQFTLLGAGWGHGVGLCQIGAALMAERGYDFRRILAHYYRGAELFALYR